MGVVRKSERLLLAAVLLLGVGGHAAWRENGGGKVAVTLAHCAVREALRKGAGAALQLAAQAVFSS